MGLRHHRIVVNYTAEEIRTEFSTSYDDPLKVARSFLWGWEDENWLYSHRKINTITVDGQTFTPEQVRSYAG